MPPHDEMPAEPGVPRDRGARPSLDEVLALRADRIATVRQVIADLTDEKLASMTEPVMDPGCCRPRCLHMVWQRLMPAFRRADDDRCVGGQGEGLLGLFLLKRLASAAIVSRSSASSLACWLAACWAW